MPLLFVNIKLLIGSHCTISWNVTIMDDDLHEIKKLCTDEKTPDITIGDHVWIGANVFITKGVIVGNGAVIAANSVVTKDVPDFTLVGGNPARIIRPEIKWE